MRARYDPANRTVLITGAGRGIGADAARRLARRGARLALLDLDAGALERVAAEIGIAQAAAFACDVTDTAQLDAAVTGAGERFGGIDIVIANAGIVTVGTVETIAPEDFERVIEVDLLGVWRTIRATLPQVIERRGYILAVSSLAAAAHAPLMGSYAAAKAGVEALANSLRGELAHRGTDVGVAYFGFIDTEMVSGAYEHPAAAEANRRLERLAPTFVSRPLPVGRAGEAIVRGVERRARRVCAPRWILPALLAPGLFAQPLIDRAPNEMSARPVELANELARSEHT
jgi:NAD(P)-dependent dehydrogenase (short-subunit alcohol dehydrogenase family)